MNKKKTALILSALFALLLCGTALASFQVFSFDLDTSKVFVAPTASAPVTATVSVRNLGTVPGNPTLSVVVKNADGVEMDTESVLIPNLAGGSISEQTLVFYVFGSWGPGNYTFYASVYDAGGLLDGQKMRVLTLQIDKPAPIPEFEASLLPLIAFSVLALLFFAGKRE